MKPEEFFKMREEQRLKEAKMAPEELAALNAARRRHARRVRSEILASAAIRERERRAQELQEEE